MKAMQLIAAAALAVAPIVTFAQSGNDITRAQVRAELVQLEKAGYNPASDHSQYPKNIEAAVARLHSGDAAYGGAAAGASQTGARQGEVVGLGSVYARP
ncbi:MULTISPECIES: DUF4148 domain-containing protein [unclassified Caballeronia]|uniref:DUF4148 domain-containing protein n=1 Tax=unclassified Caballeronia TaxID=2646786 RepID=UPI001588F4EF|nr:MULTISPECIES: DUF4148 domain-containing protein [unclassified Caballeronia]QSN64079.1 DUF4148 domain-containing protein [Caballeronia sp. M1242]